MTIISVQKAEIRFKGGRALLVGSVYGLDSDGESVEKELASFKPAAIALGISREDLESLLNGSALDVYDSYFEGLSRHGSVSIPSPDLLKSIDYARENRIELSAIDVGDNEFSEMLYDNVSSLRLVMHSRKFRVRGRSADEFSRKWDRKKNRGGFERINRICEQRMVDRIADLVKTHKRVFVLLDLPRFDNVLEMVRESYPEGVGR
jgi:hypothetical protein